MKTKLYKKWLKKCKCFDDSYFSQMYKKNYKKYASELGDKFFEKYLKYSRFWHKIKVECDLNGCTVKGIHHKDHLLHSYCPSVRLNSWATSDFIYDLDFDSVYQTLLSKISSVQKNVSNYIRIPEVVIDSNGDIKLSYKKTV